MKNIKNSLLYALIGLMIGSLMSIISMISIGHPIIVAPVELAGLLVMSALIGLLSAIFNIDRLPFWFALAVHFVLVGVIVFLTNYLMGGLFGAPLPLLLLYTVIYLVVWLILRLWWYLDAQRINAHIRKRHRP